MTTTRCVSDLKATTTVIRWVETRYRQEPFSNSPGWTTPARNTFTTSTVVRLSAAISSNACLLHETVPVARIARISFFALTGWSGSFNTVSINHDMINCQDCLLGALSPGSRTCGWRIAKFVSVYWDFADLVRIVRCAI